MTGELLRKSTPEALHRLVLLHGWGADANDLMPLGQAIQQSCNLPLELVALQAPEPHPEGMGRQWYGLFPADWDAVPGAISDLQRRLRALQTEEISLAKTVLLGFSQGGAMSLGAGCELAFAGIIACSGYPHPGWKVPRHRPPVLLVHGREDEVVPYEASQRLLSELKSAEQDAELCGFDGSHTIPGESIPRMAQAVRAWFGLS